MNDTDIKKLAPRMEDATDNTIRLCNERAASYGAMRESSLTAVALDCAAVMLAGQAARLTALEQQVSASDARVREAVERGAKAVIAYHVAICSPKGVVPDDSLYDPVIAERCEREMELARAAIRATISTKEKTDV